MSLLTRVEEALKNAMKAKDALSLQTFRMMKSALKNKQIELMRELNDDEAFKIFNTLIKQRKESIEQFIQGGRKELADKEEAEIKIISQFLPQALDPTEVENLVRQAITEVEAKSLSDMGKAIKTAMGKIAGRAEGKLVSDLVKKILGS